jgi:hypothetical protein
MDFTGGFKSIDYSRKRTREDVMSNNPDPIGKTLGENKYSCKAVLYLDWFYNTIRTINQNLGSGYADQPFNIFVSFVGTNLTPYTDTILNCTFDTTDANNAQGTSALTREIEFNPTKILFNGLDDVGSPLVVYAGVPSA